MNNLIGIHDAKISLKKQPSGTVLSPEEKKELSALLVKLGYKVCIKKQKVTSNTTESVFIVEEYEE